VEDKQRISTPKIEDESASNPAAKAMKPDL
jgi:hypothetical protein